MAALSDPLVQELLLGRHIACLGTQNSDGSIHLTSVWYQFDGDCVYVATSSRTRKARNLQNQPKASLMIDVRDPAASRGVNASGAATILTGDAARTRNLLVHRRYLSEAALADPRVGAMFSQFDDITIQLKPDSYVTWDMRELDKAVLGGIFAAKPDYLLPTER